MHLTPKEISVLIGITKSDFYGESGNLLDPIWIWSVDSPFTETPSMGGIVNSLIQKGLVRSHNFGQDDHIIQFTDEGLRVTKNLQKD